MHGCANLNASRVHHEHDVTEDITSAMIFLYGGLTPIFQTPFEWRTTRKCESSIYLFFPGAKMDSNSAIHKFVARQRELLDLELQTESDEGISGTDSNDNEGRRSHILGRLEASDVSVGLYGRTVVRLTPWSSSLSPQEGTVDDFGRGAVMAYGNARGDNPLSLLPAHRFTVGNEGEIKGGQGNKKNVICGVI